MDGENNGKPYEQMDDLGGKNPYFWRATHNQWILVCKQPSQGNETILPNGPMVESSSRRAEARNFDALETVQGGGGVWKQRWWEEWVFVVIVVYFIYFDMLCIQVSKYASINLCRHQSI